MPKPKDYHYDGVSSFLYKIPRLMSNAPALSATGIGHVGLRSLSVSPFLSSPLSLSF